MRYIKNICLFLRSYAFILFASIIFLSGCQNQFDDGTGYSNATGKSLCVSVSFSNFKISDSENTNNSFRSAHPSQSNLTKLTNLTFTATLTNGAETSVESTAALAYGNCKFSFPNIVNSAEKTYTINVSAKSDGKVIATGSSSLTVSAYTETSFVSVVLKPESGDDLPAGNVSLKIRLDGGLSDKIKSVSYDFINTDSSKNVTGLKSEFTDGKAEIKIPEEETISSGVYSLEMRFSSDESGTKNIYLRKETVNIWPGMTTDVWYLNNGYASKYLDLTESMMFDTYYVCGTGSTYFTEILGTTITGNDVTGDGSLAKPYATVQKACDRILAINDGNSTYTIYVDGTVTAPNNEHSVVELNTNVTKNLNLKIEGLENAKLLGGATKDLSKGSDSKNARLVLVGSKNKIINLTLKNIDIANGGGMPKYEDWARGGGIYFCAGAASTLILDNVKIYDCKGIWGGGAMFKDSKVILKNGTVIGNKEASSVANADEDKYSNFSNGNGAGFLIEGADADVTIGQDCYVAYNCHKRNDSDGNSGGGIALQGGKLVIEEGAFVQYNSSNRPGGGIYVKGNETLTVKGTIRGNSASDGGGIYADTGANVELNGATVSGNKGSKDGGGIYFKGTSLNIDSGSVIGDSSTETTATSESCSNQANQNGGGIYFGGGTANIEGSVLYNYAANGGGIYVRGNETLTVKGTIRGNSASDGGGIYADTGANVELNGATVSGNTASSSGGGIYFKGTSLNIDSGSVIGDSSTETTATSESCSNQANQNGGGIYFGSGTANIKGSVLYNYAASGGGGIYAIGVSSIPNINITNGSICRNSAGKGGGIFIQSVTGTISGNTSIKGNNATGKGGGICQSAGTLLTIEGGTIESNSAANGGGISCLFVHMSGGIIKDNSVESGGMGKAVYVSDKFKMSGSARIDSDNDVYLSSGKTITISGDLTGTVPVATITPAEWTAGTTILSEETSGLLAGNYKKFRVSQDGYVIKSDGTFSDLPVSGDTVYCTSQTGLTKLAEWVQADNTLSGVTVYIDNDICAVDFTPIGSSSKPFSGIIDGNGHKISEVNLTSDAFVPYLSGGTIKNLTLSGTSSDCAFTKNAENSTIENCVNEIKINNTDDSKTSIGGFCGNVKGSMTIKDCTNNADITSAGNYVGGIIGCVTPEGDTSLLSNLINKKKVYGKDEVGGIVGYSLSSDIINSANYGIVNGTNRVGGILGSLSTTNKNVGIKNCHHNDERIYADKEAGGIVGYVYLGEHNAYIQNCYSRPIMSPSAGGAQTKGCVLGLISGAGDNSNLYMESTYYYKTFYSGFGTNNGTTISSSYTNASDPIMITDDNPISNAITALNVWVNNNGSSKYSDWIVDGINGKFTWE